MVRKIRVALAGNPNCGKSTVFNGLTGAQQHVGNWPGKTVARKEGYYLEGETRVAIVDLPGIYSLSAYSPEEQIARDYIVLERPDVVVNVLDAANLERNLYLSVQILETGAPLIMLLNMSDVASRRGYQIHPDKLSRRLGDVPVIATVASRGEGLQALRAAILAVPNTVDSRIPRGDAFDHANDDARVPFASRIRGCH
jgi:ferrous iron transport protein B